MAHRFFDGEFGESRTSKETIKKGLCELHILHSALFYRHQMLFSVPFVRPPRLFSVFAENRATASFSAAKRARLEDDGTFFGTMSASEFSRKTSRRSPMALFESKRPFRSPPQHRLQNRSVRGVNCAGLRNKREPRSPICRDCAESAGPLPSSSLSSIDTSIEQ